MPKRIAASSPTPDASVGSGRFPAVRAILAVCAALLLAVQVVRNAAVNQYATFEPDAAARAWSGHPASDIGTAMTAIARATRDRKPVPASAFSAIENAADKAPLAPEPFLVSGIRAQLAGDGKRAQSAFEAAQWRDPRSLPAAFFLADRYLRLGRLDRGLAEVATLARLSPVGGNAATPVLARFATDPANWPKLRAVFRSDPGLAPAVLAQLASDRTTVPAALALGTTKTQEPYPQWLALLVNTLVTAGDYARARDIWGRANGAGTGGGFIFDSGFRNARAQPPFNWQLTSSTVGAAERQAGRLHLVYYGDEDGTLASQLLLLQPGTYRLTMQLLGDPARAHALTWSLWCDKAQQPIASVTLDFAATHGWQVQVPVGCPAQWLKLSGTAADVPQQSDVTIGNLSFFRVAPRA